MHKILFEYCVGNIINRIINMNNFFLIYCFFFCKNDMYDIFYLYCMNLILSTDTHKKMN